MHRVFIMAGEASGDLHGARLVQSIRNLDSKIKFIGIGGHGMKNAGVKILRPYDDFTAMGFVEPLLKIRFFLRALTEITKYIADHDITTVVLVDFPGFNLRLAERCKKIGCRVVFYISPQLWAWHYSRIKTIKRSVDAMIVFYPFEHQLYQREGVQSFFAGNPLVDIVRDGLRRRSRADRRPRPLIALMPGSRRSEIRRHLKPMLDAALLLAGRYQARFLLPTSSDESNEFIAGIIAAHPARDLDILLISGNAYPDLRAADLAIVASGTATLELAILEVPMIVVYVVSVLTEVIARLLVNLHDISLVNIIAGSRICPELWQRHVNGKRIAREAACILDSADVRKRMIAGIRRVKTALGRPGAMTRIAQLMIPLLKK